MAEWKRIEFLFILACIYAPAMLLIAGVVASEATASLAAVWLAVVWAVLVIALAVLLCNIYKELDDVYHIVMDAVGVSIARRLTLRLMLRLRGKAREYRRIGREIDRLREEKQLCLSLKRIHSINCNNIVEEIKKLEEKQEQVAREIFHTIYDYFYKRIAGGGG